MKGTEREERSEKEWKARVVEMRVRDKDEERTEGSRRGRKFREKRKTCRDIAVDGRKRGDRLERERSLRFSLWQVDMVAE